MVIGGKVDSSTSGLTWEDLRSGLHVSQGSVYLLKTSTSSVLMMHLLVERKPVT